MDVQIGPNIINIDELPRARVGGLRPEPVEDLFNRVRWNYAQLEFDYQKLKEAFEQQRLPEAEHPGEPQTEVAATVEQVEDRPVDQPPRREPDELARITLAAAYRLAHEVRESARRDCELMLKKARIRAREFELDFERSKASRDAELAQLDASMLEIRERMRSALGSIVPAAPLAEHANGLEPNASSPPGDGLLSPDLLAGRNTTVAAAGSEPAPLARNEP